MTNVKDSSTNLKTLLESGAFASQYESYVQSRIRSGDSFYTSVLAREGRDAAEAQLSAWKLRLHLEEFSFAPQAVAAAFVALAKRGRVDVVQMSDDYRLPAVGALTTPAYVVFNDCSTAGTTSNANLPGFNDWGPGGHLGLKAVTLQGGWFQGKAMGLLNIVLAVRSETEGFDFQSSFTVVSIDLSGHAHTSQFCPRFQKRAYLRYQLGLVAADKAIASLLSGGGELDAAIGFPGAADYLVKALPQLGPYLVATADGE